MVDWFVNGEMKPNKQTKKVNQLLYLFKGKIALQSISYTVKMQQKYSKDATVKILAADRNHIKLR